MDDWIVTLGILCGGAGILFLVWDIFQRRSRDRYTAYLCQRHASLTLADPAETSGPGSIRTGVCESIGPPVDGHITRILRNAGPHAAEQIQVTAILGSRPLQVVSAPRMLPPAGAAPIDLLIPDDLPLPTPATAATSPGDALRLRIAFADGSSALSRIEQCYVFAPELDVTQDAPPAAGGARVGRRLS